MIHTETKKRDTSNYRGTVKILPPKKLYTARELRSRLSSAAVFAALRDGKLIKTDDGWYRNNGAF